MAKINDKFKRSTEEFKNKVKSFMRSKPKSKPFRPIDTNSVSSDILAQNQMFLILVYIKNL